MAYPDFKQPFVIHIDASHTQLGAVISQANKHMHYATGRVGRFMIDCCVVSQFVSIVENVLTLSGIELVDSFYCPVYLRNLVGFPWVDMYLSTVSIRTCTYTNLVGYPCRTKRGIVIE